MAPDLDPPAVSLSPSDSSAPFSHSPPKSLWRRMAALAVAHNPFYLLSVSCVLHGTAHWFRHDLAASASPWPLMELVGGYVILLAMVGFVIVRFGKVWDDARSILLMIPLLFVELSLAFDETLLGNVATGRLLLLLGMAGAMAISEALLLGLRIRLSCRYRLPYHLLLALLFLYPVSLASLEVIRDQAAYSWRIFLFSTFAAGIALTLLPAVRRGSREVANNGTPWTWPAFPWSLFGMLFICVGFRAYALSLSFDPVLSLEPRAADRLENAFGAYYLVPLVFACGVLLLEAALVSRSVRLRRWSMMIPVFAVLMSIPPQSAPAPYFELLQRFVETLGSPLWIAILAGAVFYGWAWWRGMASGEFGCLAMLAIATIVDRRSIGLPTIHPVAVWPFAVIMSTEIVMSGRKRTSWRAILAATGLILAGQFELFEGEPGLVRCGAALVVATASVLMIGACFADRLAVLCQRLGALLFVSLSSIGLLLMWQETAWLSWPHALLLLLMAGLCGWLAKTIRLLDYLVAAVCHLGLGTAAFGWQLAILLRTHPLGKAVASFALGLLSLLVAVMISGIKAGWWRQALQRMRRSFLDQW